MDPLQSDIWAHLGHATDPGRRGRCAGENPDQRQPPNATRRRFDRGGRRRADWPEDAGMSSCPGCGLESIQSLGALDSGDYLWQCPQCDRRFQTGRATRTML